MIVSRKCLICSPKRDQFINIEDIRKWIFDAKSVRKGKDSFVFKSSDDICRFQKDQQEVVVK